MDELPFWQGVQTLAPTLLYVPAGHSAAPHLPPYSRVCSSGHGQHGPGGTRRRRADRPWQVSSFAATILLLVPAGHASRTWPTPASLALAPGQSFGSAERGLAGTLRGRRIPVQLDCPVMLFQVPMGQAARIPARCHPPGRRCEYRLSKGLKRSRQMHRPPRAVPKLVLDMVPGGQKYPGGHSVMQL